MHPGDRPAEPVRAARVPEELREVLGRCWGFPTLRPLQAEAMAAILDRRDSLVVLPTGGGKSLCFQAPALVGERRLAVVVSPLISLMKDQVDALVGSGVPAAYLNSSQSTEEQRQVAARLRGGALRLLYVSPERLVGEGAAGCQRLLRDAGVDYVAIDEAHCVSHWGHDFRPEYRQLGRLRELLPGISLHAYTATATERVRSDIAVQLGLREPEVLVGSFDRPNLTYRALRRDRLRDQLRTLLAGHREEAGIVYCITRREVERLAEALRSDGHRALPYHAGLSDEERRRHQEAFSNEEIDVIVATVAFGMGIDRSNVRFVVHVGAPKSLEHYQQEAGRAGRDGLEAECVLIYSPADFATWRRILAASGELEEPVRLQLRDMERYATQTRCRHRALVEYFGQSYSKERCGACDGCLGELEAVPEPVVVAQKILSCVVRLRHRWGMGQVVDVLRGRDTEKVRANRHDQLSTFGLLADVPVSELRGYVEQLVEKGFLTQAGDPYPVLVMPESALPLLRGEVECSLYRQRRPEPKVRRERRAAAGLEDSWEGVDTTLFEALRELRLEVARERKVPPYVIFHDSVLRHLARLRPASAGQLLAVPGIGEKKAADLGPRVLRVIAELGGGAP